ncbi:putative extracellular solute-binding protein [Klebsiella pneumoniae]|nr:putative extracellular solute-binding protein [Klebsiella pneumoniae]
MSTATKQGRLILSIRCRSISLRSCRKPWATSWTFRRSLATYYYEFNTTRPPFNDARVRRALNMALDKDIIAGKVLGQGQRPAWLIGQPDIGGVTLHNPDYASWPREKRIAEAKKLLAQAGYDESHPLVFTLLYNTSESHQRIAIAASSMWKKNLGVEAKLQNQEWEDDAGIPCIRITSTPSATRGLPTTTDAATFPQYFPYRGIARTPVSTATRLTTRRWRNAAKASDVATRGKYYQQAEDLAGAGCSRHSGLSLCTYPSGETLGRGASRRISWGITTPKTCTLKNTHPPAAMGVDFLCKLPEIQTNNTKLFVFKAVDQNDALQHPPRCL